MFAVVMSIRLRIRSLKTFRCLDNIIHVRIDDVIVPHLRLLATSGIGASPFLSDLIPMRLLLDRYRGCDIQTPLPILLHDGNDYGVLFPGRLCSKRSVSCLSLFA